MTTGILNTMMDGETLLRDLLHLIARNPALDRVVPPVLRAANLLTGATSAFYVLFDAPRVIITENLDETIIPDDDVLIAMVSTLESDIHLSYQLPASLENFAGCLVMPMRGKKNILGLMCLLFPREMDIDDTTAARLVALLDGLISVTNSTRSDERHHKLLQNQSEFVRITTHDLRQPLTVLKSILGMMEAGVMDNLTDKQLALVEKMSSNVTQMEMLVENILDAGRYDPETGFYEIQRSPADVTEVVQKIVQTRVLPAEKQALTLTYQAADDVPIINIDSHMLERAIINLVDNAIKYTPDGGKVEVAILNQNENLIIRVKDNGYGISPENLRQLFQRHFRIRRPEHNRVKGSGLGLFIVRSVAQRHGGDAYVESVEGQGSAFHIRIPLAGDNLLSAIREDT